MFNKNNLYYLLYQIAYLRFPHPNRKTILRVSAISGLALLLIYTIVYLLPAKRPISYAAASTCIPKITFLPKLQSIRTATGVNATFDRPVSIGGYPLISRSVCLEFTTAPIEHSAIPVTIAPLHNPLIKQTTRFDTAQFPALTNQPEQTLSGTISIKDPLYFSLSTTDNTFGYSLVGPTSSTACSTQAARLSCDVTKLGLAQSQTYKLKLLRTFQNKPVTTLLSSTVQTVTPITLADSSIKNSAVVYDIPRTITLTFDKPIANFKDISLKKTTGETVAFTGSNQGKSLTLTLAAPLARESSFVLRVPTVTADDKGFLTKPVQLEFTTSGGPKVIGRNVSSYNIAANTAIKITFDVALKPETAAQSISLQSGGQIIPATISTSGNTATITPRRAFGICESFNLKVTDGLQSVYGISGHSSYSAGLRSTCKTVFSIGRSVEGRAITAYKFGSGPSTILYIGATHGSELSSKYILDSWVNYLESVAPSIPANRTIVVIPAINPDGVAHISRTNAHNVDLNRNFPVSNWKPDVTLPGGQLVINGGGTSPLSEPESAALAAYTQAIRPRLTLTYHAKGSLITANESGDSLALAIQYGRSTGYRAVAESQLGNTFDYDTTGAYENWVHEKLNIPVLLIELPNNTSNYFNSNRSIMWTLARL